MLPLAGMLQDLDMMPFCWTKKSCFPVTVGDWESCSLSAPFPNIPASHLPFPGVAMGLNHHFHVSRGEARELTPASQHWDSRALLPLQALGSPSLPPPAAAWHTNPAADPGCETAKYWECGRLPGTLIPSHENLLHKLPSLVK